MAESALYPTHKEAMKVAITPNNPIQISAFFCINNSDGMKVRLGNELKFYLTYYMATSGQGKTKLVLILGVVGVVIIIECITALIVGNKIIKIKCSMLSLFGYISQDQIKEMLIKINNFKISNIVYGSEFVDRVIIGQEGDPQLEVQKKVLQVPEIFIKNTTPKITDIKETTDAMNVDQSVNQTVEELKEESRSKKVIEQLNCPE